MDFNHPEARHIYDTSEELAQLLVEMLGYESDQKEMDSAARKE